MASKAYEQAKAARQELTAKQQAQREAQDALERRGAEAERLSSQSKKGK